MAGLPVARDGSASGLHDTARGGQVGADGHPRYRPPIADPRRRHRLRSLTDATVPDRGPGDAAGSETGASAAAVSARRAILRRILPCRFGAGARRITAGQFRKHKRKLQRQTEDSPEHVMGGRNQPQVFDAALVSLTAEFHRFVSKIHHWRLFSASSFLKSHLGFCSAIGDGVRTI